MIKQNHHVLIYFCCIFQQIRKKKKILLVYYLYFCISLHRIIIRYLRSNGHIRVKKYDSNERNFKCWYKIGTGEGVAHSKRWYVALVRMHHEKKVAERLDKMGIENFVPVQQEVHQWSDRRKVVESVLLPMMVFVHADPKERKEVLSFSTVSRYMVMRGESGPTIIPDEQMARFRFYARLFRRGNLYE